MNSHFLRVVKVGGSLLPLPDLAKRLLAWLDQQTPATNVLLVGGGKAVDQIRSKSVTRNLDERVVHWKCIDIMSTTASELSKQMPDIRVQTHIPFPPNRTVIFSCAAVLKSIEPLLPGTRLPESWDVTSDSIAARLAICLDADELVLLKSADPPTGDLQELSDLGYIDKFFPKLAAELPPWRMVNLRSDSCHSEGSSTT